MKRGREEGEEDGRVLQNIRWWKSVGLPVDSVKNSESSGGRSAFRRDGLRCPQWRVVLYVETAERFVLADLFRISFSSFRNVRLLSSRVLISQTCSKSRSIYSKFYILVKGLKKGFQITSIRGNKMKKEARIVQFKQFWLTTSTIIRGHRLKS